MPDEAIVRYWPEPRPEGVSVDISLLHPELRRERALHPPHPPVTALRTSSPKGTRTERSKAIDLAIVDALSGAPISVTEVSAKTGLPHGQVKARIMRLRQRGMVERRKRQYNGPLTYLYTAAGPTMEGEDE